MSGTIQAQSAWESCNDYRTRMEAQKTAPAPIEPKGAWEDIYDFRDRIEVQANVPFAIEKKGAWETNYDFHKRLRELKETYAQAPRAAASPPPTESITRLMSPDEKRRLAEQLLAEAGTEEQQKSQLQIQTGEHEIFIAGVQIPVNHH